MFEGDRGQGGVHGKRTCSLAVMHKAAQDIPMPLPGLKNAGCRHGEP